MKLELTNAYYDNIKALKSAILNSRYNNTLPDEYQGVLPDVETLKNLMN